MGIVLIMKQAISIIVGLVTVASAIVPEVGKTFQKCDLASQLLASGYSSFTKSNIGDWICLTYYESSWKTSSKGGPNYDGSYDYGLFQINDYYWCYATSPSSATKYNDCNIDCSKLIDSSISDDCKCATKIWQRHGYSAWYGWLNHCKNRDVSSYV